MRTVALGTALTAARHFPPVGQAGPGARFFAATGHSLGGRFLAYWLTHQGESVLGAPISEVLDEGNGDGSGRRYLMQWFERGRLEYHPENTGPYTMEVGLVGRDALRARGWLPPPAAPIQTANLEAGRLPGAKLYALEAKGDVFQSDGSQAWRYRWGSIPDPAQCRVSDLAGPANGSVIYVTSTGAEIGGLWSGSGTCAPLWRSLDGSLRPVPGRSCGLTVRRAAYPCLARGHRPLFQRRWRPDLAAFTRRLTVLLWLRHYVRSAGPIAHLSGVQ